MQAALRVYKTGDAVQRNVSPDQLEDFLRVYKTRDAVQVRVALDQLEDFPRPVP